MSKHFGIISMDDDDWEYITDLYLKFFDEFKGCFESYNFCPLYFDDRRNEDDRAMALYKKSLKIGKKYITDMICNVNCFCNQLDMFPVDKCPCHYEDDELFGKPYTPYSALEKFCRQILEEKSVEKI